MKLVVLGSGIASAIAVGAMKSLAPTVYTKDLEKEAGLIGHQAIMRIRDEKIGLLLGSNLTPITVQKMLLYKDELLFKSNITTSNLYSLKAYGEINRRSIKDLEEAKRFLIKINPTPPTEITHFDSELIKGRNNQLIFKQQKCTSGDNHIAYDYCISTIPLPVLGKIFYPQTDWSKYFKAEPIFIYRGKIDIPCYVHQTIYVPESSYSTYRVTLQEDELIFECTKPLDDHEVTKLLKLYGLGAQCISLKETKHPWGKICKIDDEKRKELIWKLTEEHNIFSFGRYGVWKPIRTDHLIKDIEVISNFIKHKSRKDLYQLEKERANNHHES